MTNEIVKANDELQVAYGWASVIEEAGEVVIDHQGDAIEVGDLVKAAHGFMYESRAGGDMHIAGKTIGTVVESLVFTHELQKSLGIDLGKVGWFIGVKIKDPEVWKKVKNGTYRGFSIGGKGLRVPMRKK